MVFYTSAIRNAFSFHKLSNIHFCEHFLQISSGFKNNQRQDQHSGEKARKLGILAIPFQTMRNRPVS